MKHSIQELVGQICHSVDADDDGMTFRLFDGRVFWLGHYQECCEDVHLEEVIGDVDDLVCAPIIKAVELTNRGEQEGDLLWTFYEVATIKGTVTIRFCANLYTDYGVDVGFELLKTGRRIVA